MWSLVKKLVGGGTKAGLVPSQKPKNSIRPALECLEERAVMDNGLARSLVAMGFDPRLAVALESQYSQQRTMPSLLTPQPVSPLVQQQLLSRQLPIPGPTGNGVFGLSRPTYSVPGLASTTFDDRIVNQGVGLAIQRGPQAGVNYINYATSPQGLADLRTLGGYGRVNNLTATASAAQRIVNDPYISRLTGQAAYNGALNYFTDVYGRGGATSVNLVGVGQSVGLSRVSPQVAGAMANVALAQGVGATSIARPPGTGSGSPLIDSFGPPIGTLPQHRITYSTPSTYLPPAIAQFGPPVGYRPIDARPW